MYTLVGQVQSASDAGKLCAARLAGVDRPSFADTETSFTERRDRIARTVALLESPDHAAIEAGATPPIPRRAGGPEQANTGSAYQLQVAVSNILFHVTTADDILRHNGVALGKVNFLGLS